MRLHKVMTYLDFCKAPKMLDCTKSFRRINDIKEVCFSFKG